jgi:hypothetical protein
MNYKVENNQVIGDYAYRMNRTRGRKLGSRISELVVISNLTLSDIARIYCANKLPQHYGNNCVNVVVNTKTNLSHVLANRDNSPAYIQAIESAWRLPIATIREYYQLDKTNPLTWQEQLAFKNDYALKCFSQKIEKNLFNGVAA